MNCDCLMSHNQKFTRASSLAFALPSIPVEHYCQDRLATVFELSGSVFQTVASNHHFYGIQSIAITRAWLLTLS